MDNLGKYYLSSLESYEFEEPRECVFLKKVNFDSEKNAIVAEVSPSINGQKHGMDEDINVVVLTHRHDGYDLFPIQEFPCFVFIAIPLIDDILNHDVLDISFLKVVAWGELYRTEKDAKDHVFET